MTGGSSGWSAPPDVFQEKSLLEIEEEKRQRKSQNKSKKSAPKINERFRFLFKLLLIAKLTSIYQFVSITWWGNVRGN